MLSANSDCHRARAAIKYAPGAMHLPYCVAIFKICGPWPPCAVGWPRGRSPGRRLALDLHDLAAEAVRGAEQAHEARAVRRVGRATGVEAPQ
jgi:hypothetical protein